MGNRAHGQLGHMGHNFLNTAWILTKILLEIDIDGFLFKFTVIFTRWLDFSIFFHVFVIAALPELRTKLHFFAYSRTMYVVLRTATRWPQKFDVFFLNYSALLQQ